MLVAANIAFVVAILLHGADHQIRGTGDLTTEVMAGGAVIALLGFTTLFLTLRHHPRAPLVAAVAGFYTAVGVSASHLAPHWSAFSDPYMDKSLSAVSWAAALAEIAAAAILGVVALRELRRPSVAAA